MSENSVDTHSGFKTFAIIVLIVVVSAGWYFIIYEDMGSLFSNNVQKEFGSYTAAYEAPINETSLDLFIQAEIAGIELFYLESTSSNLIELSWDYKYVITDRYSEDPMEFIITNSSSNNSLDYNIMVDYHSEINPNSIRAVSLEIGLNPLFNSYGFDVEIDVGSFYMDIADKTFTAFNIRTTTGSIELELTDIVLDANPYILTTTGEVDVLVENLELLKNATFTIETTTGGGSVDWLQFLELGANLELIVIGDVGGYDINIDLPLSLVRYDVQWEDDLGDTDIEFEPDFQKLSENHYQSTNFDNKSVPLVSLYVEIDVGGSEIEIDASD